MELRIQERVPLAAYTTLKVGGEADYFVTVHTEAELAEALRFAKQTGAPPLILGAGSNVLISDAGYRGVVIQNDIQGRSYEPVDDSVLLTCGAGEELDAVIADTAERGYWGLENLSAIPGSVGATPIQNVGAYGVEVSMRIRQVTAMHVATNEVREFSNAECQFSYRDSFFKTTDGRQWVILSVTFSLTTTPAPQLAYGALQELQSQAELTPAQVRAKVIEIRTGKFPDWHTVGTAGSFFKNPIVPERTFTELKKKYPELPGYPTDIPDQIKVSLGWILDHVCQLRGYCRDTVCLYEQQALVLVATSPATAAAIDDFANEVAAIVQQQTGIDIEREVRSV